jgi:hypothetical protein
MPVKLFIELESLRAGITFVFEKRIKLLKII